MWNIAPFNSSYNNMVDNGSLIPDEDSLIRMSLSQNNVFDRVCVSNDSIVGIDLLGKVYKYSLKTNALEWEFQSLSRSIGGGLYLDDNLVITPAEIIDATSGSIIFNLFEESEYLQNLTSEKISDFGLLFKHEKFVLRTSLAKSGAKVMKFGLDDFSLEIKNIPFIPDCYTSEGRGLLGIDNEGYIVKFLFDSEEVSRIGCFDFTPLFLSAGVCSKTIVGIDPVEGCIASLQSGEQMWKKSPVDFSPDCRNFSQAVAVDGDLIITTIDDGYSYWILAIDVNSGKMVWKSNGETSKGFCVSGENVYTVRGDGTPIIFDRTTGEIKWSSAVNVPANKVIISNDYIVYLDMTFNAAIFTFK